MTRVGVAVALLLAAAPAAANEHLERANEHLDNLEFAEARAELTAALRAGDNGPSELSEIYMLSGIVAASFGDEPAAREAFRKLLSLDPNAKLGGGLAPKIVTPFEAAKRSQNDPLLVRYEPYAYGDEELVIVVESDPENLVAGAIVLFRDTVGEPYRLRAKGSTLIAVPLPALPKGKVKIGIVDDYGNRVAVIAWEAPEDTALPEPDAEPDAEPEPEPEPAPAAAVTATITAPKPRAPIYERWQVWAGTSAGLFAIGTYYGLQTRGDQREFNSIVANSSDFQYEDAVAVLDRGNRHALIANVAFGAAAVTTAVSAYLFLRDRKSEAPRVAPVPVEGGAAVTWEVQF